jgi:hypothetical protein
MATEVSSFFAPTAPETAMAADTPHTAPPAPSVAAKRRSRPSLRATRKMVKKVASDTIAACVIATGPAQRTSVTGSVAPSRTMPTLT